MESGHPINVECSVGGDSDVTGNKLVLFITDIIINLILNTELEYNFSIQ